MHHYESYWQGRELPEINTTDIKTRNTVIYSPDDAIVYETLAGGNILTKTDVLRNLFGLARILGNVGVRNQLDIANPDQSGNIISIPLAMNMTAAIPGIVEYRTMLTAQQDVRNPRA